MFPNWRPVTFFLVVLLISCFLQQEARAVDRLPNSLDTSRLVPLPGNSRATRARGFDQGAVEGTFSLPYITLTFAPSAGQGADLKKLLSQQQNPSSRRYHQWLTPEQYADRFGLSVHDSQMVSRWLQEQGFSVIQTARGRNWIAFTGTAAQVKSAFHTEIHQYSGRGHAHFANAEEPWIPRELRDVIVGYRGLDNFAISSLPTSNRRIHRIGTASGAKANDTIVTANPDDGTVTISHVLAPDDVATIYNLTPLYHAGTDGGGQKLVVVGQSEVSLADIEQFRPTSR